MIMAHVLVVDDEFGILRLLEDVFSDEGHTVDVAVNGRQALQRIDAHRPDIVLSDFMMPVMDGGELLKACKSTPDLADIPFLLMSSLPEMSIQEHCAGYDVFVRKPFKIFELTRLVSTLIGP